MTDRMTRLRIASVALVTAIAVVLGTCACGESSSTGGDSSTGTAQRGGTLLVAFTDEPGICHPLFDSESGAEVSLFTVLEPLFAPRDDGGYDPLLAAEIPTKENGGISEDSLTVTYKLRSGITWSDGEPFTSADVVFTWEVIGDPESAAVDTAMYDLVESVTAVDDLTVEVKMSSPNPRYLEMWDLVLPKHQFASTKVTAESPEVRMPLGTGPFVFKEWVNGDRVELVRNGAYWRDPALPYLDGITYKVFADRQVAVTSFIEGEFDTVFFLNSGNVPDVMAAAEQGRVEAQLQSQPSWAAFLWLNHSDPANPEDPHPVLGDPAIREAIDRGVNRQEIVDEMLQGYGTLIGSYLYVGSGAHSIDPTPYDPDLAREVLDESGWKVGSDGFRSKDGVRASVEGMTIAGDQQRKLILQLIQAQLREVGIEFKPKTVQLNRIFAGYQDDGLLATGHYDILMSNDGYYIDPALMTSVFTTGMIPTEQQPNGFTYSHLSLPAFDELAAKGAQIMDPQERSQVYAEAAELFASERIALPLYACQWVYAWSPRLKGVTMDSWYGQWNSDIAAWYLTTE